MSLIKSFIKKIFSYTGYDIQKIHVMSNMANASTGVLEMSKGIERMQQLKIFPDIVVDIGAARGEWSEMAMKIWPSAQYKLIEPLSEQTGKLNQLKSSYTNLSFYTAVAGEAPGEIIFNVSDDLDGSGIYGIDETNARKVPVITIDDIVKDSPGTIVIKLDTHGYEVPILKGSKEALKKTSLLIIEVYGFYVSPTCLLFQELSAYLDNLGFRLIDIVDIMRRPGDKAFWQADAFYLRKEHPVFAKDSYA